MYPGQYSTAALSEFLLDNNVLLCGDIPSNEGGCDQHSGVICGPRINMLCWPLIIHKETNWYFKGVEYICNLC